MLANYGYQDASGEYYITIDTDRCDGCGECASVCPASVFDILEEDPNDVFREAPVAVVADEKRKALKYECNPCKPKPVSSLPCIQACKPGAISHSW